MLIGPDDATHQVVPVLRRQAGDDRNVEALAFGYACLGDPQCAEWGYVSLVELEGVLARGVFPVERDLHWTPKPAKDCKLPGSAF